MSFSAIIPAPLAAAANAALAVAAIVGVIFKAELGPVKAFSAHVQAQALTVVVQQ